MIVVVGRVRTDAANPYEDTELENEFVLVESGRAQRRCGSTSPTHVAELMQAIPATIVAPPDVKFHTIASSIDLTDVSAR